MTQSKLIIVCYVNGQPKGLMSEYQFMNYTSKRWWDKIEQIEVPFTDWIDEKVTISNIQSYVDKYKS